jgi:hypothetical protein
VEQTSEDKKCMLLIYLMNIIKGMWATLITCGLIYTWVRKQFCWIRAGDTIKLSALCAKFCKIFILFYKLVRARI